MGKLLTAEEWLQEPEYAGLEILDPDGWDRSPEGWEQSWNEKIDRREFTHRLFASSVQYFVPLKAKRIKYSW